MDLIGRIKKICLTPDSEWSVIAEENTPAGSLITQYVLPLAGVAAVAGFIGGSLIGRTLPFVGGTYRVPIATGLGLVVFSLVTAVIAVFLISLIIDALAPTFGAQKNSAQAFKVAVYSFTPAWVAGVFQILPALAILAVLGALYGLYLLYLGLPRLMKCPPDKAVGYTAVVVISAIVVSVVLSAVGALVIGGSVGSGGLAGVIGGGAASTPNVAVDPNSALGRLGQLGQELEKSANKAAAAEKAGDQAGQVAAGLETLGTLLGGGARVDPIDIALLKPLVPETFAGLPRTSSSAEKTGIGTLMVSKAEATYGDGANREVRLEITDTGGVSGLVGLAAWTNVQEERESEDGYSRTQKVGGRLTHMESSKSGDDEFGVVIGERFLVTARSRTLDVDALRTAVSGLDLGKLESMKGVGVTK